MPCIQVIGNIEKMDNLGIYDIDDYLFNILFPNNQNLVFYDDFKQKKILWEDVKDKLEITEAKELNGILGTVHLKESFVQSDEFPNRKEQIDDPLQLNRIKIIDSNQYYIQVLDGAVNSTCDIYAIDKESYENIFKNEKNILYSSEIPLFNDEFWTNKIYSKPIEKRKVPRLDGILVLFK